MQAIKRRAGTWLQRQRRALFNAEPLCRACMGKGRVTLATERDHILPLHKGGQDVASNVQPLCDDCHRDKTAADMGHRVKVRTGLDGWSVID